MMKAILKNNVNGVLPSRDGSTVLHGNKKVRL